MNDIVKCPMCAEIMTDFDYQSHDCKNTEAPMNNKCCNTCIIEKGESCPVWRVLTMWNEDKDFCSRYTPKPEAPGKIEPLENRMWQTDVLVGKINEIIAELNRRGA